MEVLGAEIIFKFDDFYSRVSLNGGFFLVVDDPLDLEQDSIIVVLE